MVNMTETPGIAYTNFDARWQAVVTKDPHADGKFYTAVTTTHIYCRPTCKSRLPKPENVRFVDTIEEAERAGFRPCKRCQPQLPANQRSIPQAILQVCKILEQAEHNPTLNELAEAVLLSPYYLQRQFREHVGISPRQYYHARRAERLRALLTEQENITQSIYDAGFSSTAPMYSGGQELLGMTPGEYKQGGKDQAISYAVRPCSLGWVLVAATERGVCAVEFGDTAEETAQSFLQRFPHAAITTGSQHFEDWVSAVIAAVDRQQPAIDLPLDVRGTAFQYRVWAALRQIPSGQTATYQQIAQRIGQPRAARAVGHACASNQVAVLIPCHRALRSDGQLGGYRWKLHRKHQLLKQEAGR